MNSSFKPTLPHNKIFIQENLGRSSQVKEPKLYRWYGIGQIINTNSSIKRKVKRKNRTNKSKVNNPLGTDDP
jgi:hypothetical protein